MFAGAVALILVFLGAYLAMQLRKLGQPLAEDDLGDGRIFKVEAVTFAKIHQVGIGSPILEKFGRYMPDPLREFLAPKTPRSTISREEPSLVIWLNAVDSTFRTNVDCQGIRMEIKGADGTIYGESQPNWFGFGPEFNNFRRAGHLFRVFPRDEKTLHATIVTWRATNSLEFVLPNPGYSTPVNWTGKQLPLTNRVGAYEIVLHELTAQMHNGRTKVPYWRPEFELRRDGERVDGWDLEWIAEDAWGNRDQRVGVNKSPLKFFATYYPSGTNMGAAVLITNTPAASLASTNWWNISAMVGTNRAELIGLFPPGTHTFSEGEYLTNPPTKLGPVRGGSASGWVSQTRSTPLRTSMLHGHYTDVPVIYMRVTDPQSADRIAIRIRDVEGGEYSLAESESQGYRGNILAFLVKTKADRIVAELVHLPPVKADFLVETPRPPKLETH